jgi:hypothetical protein
MTSAFRRTVERCNKRDWWPILPTEISAKRAPFRLITPLDKKRTAYSAKKLTFATPRPDRMADSRSIAISGNRMSIQGSRLRTTAAITTLLAGIQQLYTRQRQAHSSARRKRGRRGEPHGAIFLVDRRADRLKRLPFRLHGHHVTRDVQADVSARPVVGKGNGAIRVPFGHIAIGVVPVPDRSTAAHTRDIL